MICQTSIDNRKAYAEGSASLVSTLWFFSRPFLEGLHQLSAILSPGTGRLLFWLPIPELAVAMRKSLIFLTIAAVGVVVAFHYLPPDFFSIADASNNGSAGAMADMDQPLPQAVLPSLTNDWVDLSTYKGQVVFIVFWTTWCPGCIDEVPTLIHLQQEFSGKGFTVLAIAVDDQGEESVESFVGNKRFSVNGVSASINYPVLRSSDEIARKLGFEGGLPAGVLVDRNGREVKIMRGVVSEAAVSKAIQHLVRN